MAELFTCPEKKESKGIPPPEKKCESCGKKVKFSFKLICNRKDPYNAGIFITCPECKSDFRWDYEK